MVDDPQRARMPMIASRRLPTDRRRARGAMGRHWMSGFAMVLLLSGTPAVLHGASNLGSAAPGRRGECPGGRISSIFIDNHSVFDLADTQRDQRFDWALRLANRLHIPTREQVIRRELVFEEGGCYDPELLRESERVLRTSDFIATVDIFGVRQPDGSYHVIVDTRDEWSTRVEVQTGPNTGLQPTGISLRETNLLGTAQQASVFYLRSREERVYGASYLNPQLFGTRWQVGAAAGKTPIGSLLRETVEYPFVGETGRRAARHHIEHHERFFRYLAMQDGSLVEVLVPERRRSFDLGGAIRFGERGRLTSLGALLAGEWVSYPAPPRLADPRGETAAPDSLFDPILEHLDSVADVRAMVLVGQRNVYYVTRRALDTVNGTEDVRLGMEVEMGFGRSIIGLSSQDDLLLDLAVFGAGQIGDGLLVGTRALLEGKRDHHSPADKPEWRDVLAQLNVWTYWQPSAGSRHTLVGAVAASGGWSARVPFQLTLGSASGLRGRPFHLSTAAQRVVGSLEARSYLGGPLSHVFDLGSVAFVDVGRSWAGDAPFGVDSPVHANVGVGLRAAFPPGSRSTFRFDVAAPLGSGFRASELVVSLGLGQAIGRAAREDPELRRSSPRGRSTSMFSVRSDREY